MPLVIGHSQTKYLSEYLPRDLFTVFPYPGYKTSDFLAEEVIYDVIPFHDVVVLLVGANDIGSKSTEEILEGIRELCMTMKVHSSSPSAKVIVSEVLPRSQNKFPGGHLSKKFLTDWNRDATSVNFGIIGLAAEVLTHEEFRTAYGVAK